MKNKQSYLQDLAEVRAMMERSSKFLSLSGLAGVLAGLYALLGSYIVWRVLGFDPAKPVDLVSSFWGIPEALLAPVAVAVGVLFFAAGTAIILSAGKARSKREKLWNPAARRMIIQLLVPLVCGGTLALIFMARGMAEVTVSFTLIFYGLGLYNAGRFTYGEISSLGLINLVLGLLAAWKPAYGLLCWAAGFGLAHILYGIYMHYRYER